MGNVKRKIILGLVSAAVIAGIAVLSVLYCRTNGTFDFRPPLAETERMVILNGETVTPERFVKNIADNKSSAEAVSVSFLTAPDTNIPGERPVEIVLEDAGGNRTVVTSEIVILNGEKTVVVEAGTDPVSIGAEDFVREANALLVTPVEELDLSVHGAAYDVEIAVDGHYFNHTLEVRDTIPPTGSLAETFYTSEVLPDPASVSVGVEDVTAVTADWGKIPDFSKPGDVMLFIILTDEAGNTRELFGTVQLKNDKIKPVIDGAVNQTVTLNSTITYRDGVTVTDDLDPNVDLVIDSSAVRLDIAGKYDVWYRAKDASGNEAVKKTRVTVLDASEDAVMAKADQILASIITDDMDEREKVWAIYSWMRRNVSYTSAVSDNEIQGAYDAYFRGYGNCFTYAMGTRLLLTRAGFENMIVTRVRGTPTTHKWNLVKVENVWYHLDTCINPINAQIFLIGEERAAYLSSLVGGKWVHKYWWYDKELYPPIAP